MGYDADSGILRFRAFRAYRTLAREILTESPTDRDVQT